MPLIPGPPRRPINALAARRALIASLRPRPQAPLVTDYGDPGVRYGRPFQPTRTLIEQPGIWPAPPLFALPGQDITAMIAEMARQVQARRGFAAGRML